MEKVINSYESLFIVDVTNGEEATEATVNKFLSIIEANAEVVDVAKWGKRRLAYPINDMPEGYYTVVTFKAEGSFPAEFERLCGIDENVMRSMVIKLEYDATVAAAKKAAAAEAAAVAAAEAAKAAAEATVEAVEVEETVAADAE